MVQRTPTLVITSKTGVKMLLEPYYMEGGPPTEVRPFPKIVARHQLWLLADASAPS